MDCFGLRPRNDGCDYLTLLVTPGAFQIVVAQISRSDYSPVENDVFSPLRQAAGLPAFHVARLHPAGMQPGGWCSRFLPSCNPYGIFACDNLKCTRNSSFKNS